MAINKIMKINYDVMDNFQCILESLEKVGRSVGVKLGKNNRFLKIV